MIRLLFLACLGLCACTALCRADVPGQGGPLPVAIDADMMTQVVTSENGAYLLANISVANHSRQPQSFSTASVKLHIGGSIVPHEIPDEEIAVLVESDKSRRTAELSWFEEDVLPAGEKLVRWCCFNLAESGYLSDDPSLFDVPPWSLVVEAKGGTASFDLKEHEIQALGARCRPSRLAASVTVVEIGSRLNSLNVGVLEELVDGVLSREAGFVAVLTHGKYLIEDHAARRISDFRLRRGSWHDREQMVMVEDGDGRDRAYRLGPFERAPSEDVAAVMVLGRRLDAARDLVGFLSHDSMEVRIAAATALGPHLAAAGVCDALARLVRQSQPQVDRQAQPPNPEITPRPRARGRFRSPLAESTPQSNLRIAAILALGSRTVTAAQGRTPDSDDTLAILAALDDGDPSVRSSAVSVAERFAFPQVIGRLMRLLDDPAVQGDACQKLADLKHVAAREKIDRLRTTAAEPWVQFAAIQALERLGAMSHREALFARLDAGQLSYEDCTEIVRLKDPRTIPKLIDLIKNSTSGRRAQSAVETLIALQMPETVEPLIELLKLSVDGPGEKVLARGRHPPLPVGFGRDGDAPKAIVSGLAGLGDPRAIEPIRDVLAAQRLIPLSQQLVYYDALLTLKAPDALPVGEQLVAPNDWALAAELLTMLARHDDEQVLPFFAEFLKNGSFATMAAEKLSYLSMEGAESLLSDRLRQTQHPMHLHWVEGVRRNPLWLANARHKALVSGAAAAPVPYRNLAYRNVKRFEAADQRQVSRQRWPRREMLGDAAEREAWFRGADRHPAGAVACNVDLTQDWAGLFLRIKLANHTDAALPVRAADFALQAGEEWAAAMRVLRDAPEPNLLSDGVPKVLRASALAYWSDVVLAPGEASEGWLAFEISSAMEAQRLGAGKAAPPWTLWMKAGDKAVAFDLSANESRAFELIERPSSLDASVHVIDMKGRINCINAKLFVDRLESLTEDKQDYLVSLVAESCIIGSGAVERWEAWLKKHVAPERWPVAVVGNLPVIHRWKITPSGVQYFASEHLAAIAALERRPGTGQVLAKCLTHDRPEIRAAAARALASHLDEDGVGEALARAFADVNPAVRLAAVEAIARSKKPLPNHLQADGSGVETAVLAAIDSPDDAVRQAALLATRWFPSDRVEQALRGLVDASPVEYLAADILAKRQTETQVEKADEIGARSAVDDLLAKLDEVRIAPEALKEAGKLNDPRIIAKLISLAQLSDVGMLRHHVDQSAVMNALVELHATEAVEPLAALLRKPAPHHNERTILHALVRLGDLRAIELIRNAIGRAEPEWRFRLPYYEALARLGDRDAIDTLANLLKEPLPRIETEQLLRSLAASGRDELVALVEPFLDDKGFCSEAAYCLAHCGDPQAVTMLQRRLTSTEYPLSAALFEGLQRQPTWLESPPGQSLLKDVARDGNVAAKRLAEDLLSEE